MMTSLISSLRKHQQELQITHQPNRGGRPPSVHSKNHSHFYVAPRVSQIINGLYIGGSEAAFSGNLYEINASRVLALVDAGTNSQDSEGGSPGPSQLNGCCAEDSIVIFMPRICRAEHSLFEILPQCFEYIDSKSNSGTLVVDYEQGSNQAAVVCIAYLVIAMGYTLEAACNTVKLAHPDAAPDPTLLYQLLVLERQFSESNLNSTNLKSMAKTFYRRTIGLKHSSSLRSHSEDETDSTLNLKPVCRKHSLGSALSPAKQAYFSERQQPNAGLERERRAALRNTGSENEASFLSWALKQTAAGPDRELPPALTRIPELSKRDMELRKELQRFVAAASHPAVLPALLQSPLASDSVF